MRSSARFAAALLAIVVVIAALGWLDYWTGPDIGFSLFYLLPLVTAGWFLGRSAAVTAALTAATAWFVADFLMENSTLAVTIWNGGTRLVIYAAIAWLVARLRDETGRLERVNAELDAFSHSVSHDLRAPLIQIGRYAEMVERHATLDEDGRRHLGTIERTAADGLKLVDDLLEFAQLARTDVDRAPVNLNAVVERVRVDLVDPDQARDIRWRIHPLPVVRGDGPMLEVAVRNLVANALKFTRPREQAIIEIGAHDEPDGPVVYVRDNGVGFSPEYAQRIFGVFERLHGQGEFEGTGIGLALVHRIITRHGGRVWAEGEPDRGATFFLKFPVKR